MKTIYINRDSPFDLEVKINENMGLMAFKVNNQKTGSIEYVTIHIPKIESVLTKIDKKNNVSVIILTRKRKYILVDLTLEQLNYNLTDIKKILLLEE